MKFLIGVLSFIPLVMYCGYTHVPIINETFIFGGAVVCKLCGYYEGWRDGRK